SLLAQHFPEKPLFMGSTHATEYVMRDDVNRFSVPVEKPPALDGALALCGIARPESLKKTLAERNITVSDFMVMPDHHRYKEADIARIRSKIKKRGACAVVTTEKDMVKLGRVELGVAVYGIRLQVEMEKPFCAMILETAAMQAKEKNMQKKTRKKRPVQTD
ncbi:MAG TPA: hypothetical protein ENK84_10405, partial [Desulfobulbus sp.]|nr:hypothetical protein [Desulfobulbus sp.]